MESCMHCMQKGIKEQYIQRWKEVDLTAARGRNVERSCDGQGKDNDRQIVIER